MTAETSTVKKVHILFGPSAFGSLKMALKTMKLNKQEQVIAFREVFSVGPVLRLHEEAGRQLRSKWQDNNLNYKLEDSSEYHKLFTQALNEVFAIPEESQIVIWTGSNAHEQTGLRFALYLLQGKCTDIRVINTAEAYGELFNTKKVTYEIRHSGEIDSERFEKIYKRYEKCAPLTKSDRKTLEGEWTNISETHETLRIWKDGTIESHSEEYYDQYILNMAKKLENECEPGEFMIAPRVIGEVLGHLNQYVDDQFFEYRIRSLIEKDEFEMKGNLKGMRFYSVRLKK
ncbi:DUF1835 domain-containing protein [Sporosarcina siberiensis]|uniref:DUF1835 domain-containing protein n=1 Tax=Sporosarcina siberiensis TaxID=1365606 RepID=A0ABW4SG07_9BACL